MIFECVPVGKNIRVIDPFTIKPLDATTILENARATGGQIITVEDHYKEGGLFFPCANVILLVGLALRS